MPKTAYSQKFQIELDPEQLLSLLGYDLSSDPDLKKLSGQLRREIHRDLTCPECGATGGIIVSRSKSQKDYIAILNDFLRASILTYFGEIKFMFVSKKLKQKFDNLKRPAQIPILS